VHTYAHTHTRKYTHIYTQVANDGKVLVWENSVGNLEISGKIYRCILVGIYIHSKVKIYVCICILILFTSKRIERRIVPWYLWYHGISFVSSFLLFLRFFCFFVSFVSSFRSVLSTCGVATISRLLKNIGPFCRKSSFLQVSFAQETYNFQEPTNRSHPIQYCIAIWRKANSLPFFCVTCLIPLWHDSFKWRHVSFIGDMSHSYATRLIVFSEEMEETAFICTSISFVLYCGHDAHILTQIYMCICIYKYVHT